MLQQNPTHEYFWLVFLIKKSDIKERKHTARKIKEISFFCMGYERTFFGMIEIFLYKTRDMVQFIVQ